MEECKEEAFPNGISNVLSFSKLSLRVELLRIGAQAILNALSSRQISCFMRCALETPRKF